MGARATRCRSTSARVRAIRIASMCRRARHGLRRSGVGPILRRSITQNVWQVVQMPQFLGGELEAEQSIDDAVEVLQKVGHHGASLI